MTQLYEHLLSVFQKFSAKSTGALIMGVLASWGYRRKNEGLSKDEREMAYRFYRRFKELSPSFNYERCQEKYKESPIILTYAEIDEKTEELVTLICEFSFEIAIEQFTLAAYDWLCCCDFQHFKEPSQTEQEAKLWFLRGWVEGLGVE